MRHTNDASEVIVAAVASLRSLAEEALADRCYGDMGRIASLTDALWGLSQRAMCARTCRKSRAPAARRPARGP